MSEVDPLIPRAERDGYGSAKSVESSFHIPPDPELQHTWSLVVVFAAALVGEMARGILFPIMWLRVEAITGGSSSLGVVVAAFSCGRIIGAPLFGYISEQYNYKRVLITCNFILILGALVFAFAPSFLMLVVAQLLMGLGAGNLGTLRSYVAETTARTRRTEYIAYLTTLQYAGFVVTPILGALLSAAAPHMYLSIFTRYSVPALFIAASALVCIYFLHIVFRDIRRSAGQLAAADTANQTERKLEQNENDHSDWLTIHTDEREATDKFFICAAGCLLNFFTKGTIAIFETLIIMFALQQLRWTTLQACLTISTCGVVAVFILSSFSWLLKVVDDVDLVSIGLSTMVLGCLLLDATVLPDVTSTRCYLALVLMFAVGYPVGHTALIGVFSKVIKSGPQGAFLGIFASVGSLARIFFPAFSAWFVHNYGFNAAFSFAAVLLALCLIYLMLHRRDIRQIISD